MDCSLPGSSVRGISRQEYWSGLPFSSSGDLPNPGIEPGSPTLQADALPSEPPGKLKHSINVNYWFQIGKGVCQGCILSPCLFNFCAEYIMRNAGLEEAQAGIKIVRRNINNLRYADDTTLMAESEEELKSLLMKVKRRVKKLA